MVNLDEEFTRKENEPSINMPLISPQSTLTKKPTSAPPGFTLPLEPSNLASIINESTCDIFNNSCSSIENTLPNVSTSSTNPFVQTESIYDTVSAQNFLEMWKQNLQLQMQITAAFNALFSNITPQSGNKSFDTVKSEGNRMPVSPEQQLNSTLNSCSDTLFENNNCKPEQTVRETMREMPNTAYSAGSSTGKANMTNVESNNLFAQPTATDSDVYVRMFSKEIHPASINETPITSVVNENYENSKLNDTLNVDRPCGESRHSFKEFSENCYTTHSNNADFTFKNSNRNVEHILTEDKLSSKFNSPRGKHIVRNDCESKLFQDAATNDTSEYFEQTRFDSKDARTFNSQSLKETNPFKMYVLNSQEFQEIPKVQDTSTNDYKTPPPVPKRNPNLINKMFCNTKNHNQDIANVSNVATKIVYEAKPIMYNAQDRKQVANSTKIKCENVKETVKHLNNNNTKSLMEPERPEYFQNVTNNNPEYLSRTTAKMNNTLADTIFSSQEKIAETDFTSSKKSFVEWNNLTNVETVQNKPDTYHTQFMQRDVDNVNQLHSMCRENRSSVNSLNSLSSKMNNCHITDTSSETFSTNLRQNLNPYSTIPLQPRIISSSYRPPPPPYKEITGLSIPRVPVSPQIVTPAMTELSKVAIEELSIKFDIPDNTNQIDEGYITRPPTSHTFDSSPVYTPIQTTFRQDFNQDYTTSAFTFSSPTSTNKLRPTIFSNVLPTLLLKSVDNARTSRSEILKSNVWKRSSMSLQNKWFKNCKERNRNIFGSKSKNNSSDLRTYYQKLLKSLKNSLSKCTFYQSATSTELQHLLDRFNLRASSFQRVPMARNKVQGSCVQTIHNVKESDNATCNAQNKEISKDISAMYTTVPTRTQTITCTNKLMDTVCAAEAIDNSSILLNREKINLSESTTTNQKEFALDAKLEMKSSVVDDIVRSRTKTNSYAEFSKADNGSVSEVVNNLRVSSESKEINTIKVTMNQKESILEPIVKTESIRNKDAVESEMRSLQSCNSDDFRNNTANDFNFPTTSNRTDASSCSFFITELSNRTMYVFHLDEEGWVSTDDFVEAFTDFKMLSVMLRLLDIINVNVPFKVLTRSDQPLIFSLLDESTLIVPRNAERKIKKPIHLTPLKSAIRLLVKLKIISHDEVQRAVVKKEFKSGSVLYDLMKLIAAYGSYKRSF